MAINPIIPNDAEQKAADAGIQTQAQILANQNMDSQNVKKGQEYVDSGASSRLQNGFETVQAIARAARTNTEIVPPPVQVVKKSAWAWLTGK